MLVLERPVAGLPFSDWDRPLAETSTINDAVIEAVRRIGSDRALSADRIESALTTVAVYVLPWGVAASEANGLVGIRYGLPPAAAKPSRVRRVLHVLVALLVFAVLPVMLVGAIVGQFGVGAMSIGLLLGVVGSKIGGTRRMLYLTPAIGVAAGLGAFTAYDWWWATLLASVGVIAGAGTRFGWFPALLMVPYAATFVVPVSTGLQAVTYGTIAALATGYGIVLARRFGAVAVVDGRHLPLPGAVGVAIVFGVVLGAAAAVGVALSWSKPYWVPDPILVLILYIIIGKRERIRGKAIGTAIGTAAAIGVAIVAPSAGVLAVLATVAFLLALTQVKRYWLMYALVTFGLVIYLAAPGQLASEAVVRGFQYLAGIVLLVVGLVMVHLLGNWLRKRYPQAELAPGGPSA